MRRFLSALALCGGLLLPSAVLAASPFIESVLNGIGGPAVGPGCTGAWCFIAVAQNGVMVFRPLLIGAAIVLMTITGFRMVVGQEDDALDKSKAIVSACISGIVLSLLIGPFLDAFYVNIYTFSPTGNTIDVTSGATIVSTQIGGFIDWVLIIAAPLAMVMMFISAFKAITKYGSDEGVAGMRRTIFSIAAGIALIVFRSFLGNTIQGSPTNPKVSVFPIFTVLLRIINYTLGFVAFAAVAIVIYSGIQIVLNFGREDHIRKHRSLIIRAIIGLAVILLSITILNLIYQIVVGKGFI